MLKEYEYEYVFVNALHARLKEEIIGKIYVTVSQDDVLYVNILSVNDTKYTFVKSNFADKIYGGWTSEYAAFEVIREYRNFIVKRYFK